ncbi:hypothetical protein MASR1M74_22450 [Lentimicrobium sp.]
MDFTFTTYHKLLNALQSQGFLFYTVSAYMAGGAKTKAGMVHTGGVAGHSGRAIILRHDVEARYGNALKMAKLQHKLGIRGTYYFRIFPGRGNEAVIREIVGMGHEIGYHYDDLSACRGDYEKALQRFQKNLAYLRRLRP